MLDFYNLTSLLLGICVVCVSLFCWQRKNKYNLPPGPWSLPVIGYLPFIRSADPIKVVSKLREKYGNIFGFYIGTDLTVILNGDEIIKGAFNNPALQDRPPSAFDFVPDGVGFVGSSGPEWVEQRRFAMKSLKDLGMTKNPWELDLEAEVEDFIQYLEKHSGQPLDISHRLLSSASNNLTSIVLGKRLPHSDPRRKLLDAGIHTTTRLFSNSANLVFHFPNVLKFFAKLGISSRAKDYRSLDGLNIVFRKEINERKTVPSDERGEMFIDGYLQEIKRNEENHAKSSFNETNLCGVAKTIVIGGSDTTRATIEWLLLAMAAFQDVQKRVQDEIDHVLGLDGKVKWMEREKLPYTYATAMEVLRWRTTAPLGVLHRAREDTKIRNFDIPKGTNLLANIWALHNDPKYWKDPGTFNPKRFLDNNGALIMDHRLTSYMPFAIGRRMCPGENIVMISMFRYFTGILQKFNIRPLEGKAVNLEGSPDANLQPTSQEILFNQRK